MRNVSNWSQDVLGIDPDDPLYDEIAHVLAQMWWQFRFDPSDPTVQAQARKVAEEAHERARRNRLAKAAAGPPKPPPNVVYYLRVGQYIKVGTTFQLAQRLKAYPPDAILLATEPGDGKLERQRHKQFADDLVERLEWFRPSVALVEHINSLREEPLTAAELAA